MAAGARGSPRRLVAVVFAVAATVTAVLSLDARSGRADRPRTGRMCTFRRMPWEET